MKIRRFIMLVVATSCLFGGFYVGAGIPIVIKGDEEPAMTYKLIPLQSLNFSTVEKVCRPWLHKGGLLIHEKNRRAILVYAQPAVINRIMKFVASTDSPNANIKIELDRQGSGQNVSEKFSYNYNNTPQVIRGRGGRIIIKKPKNKLNLHSRRTSTSSTTSSFIVTQSGSPAQLWVGKSIVDPTWRRYQRPDKTVVITPHSTTVVTMPQEPVMTDVGVSLQVLPRDLGNGMIEVEVYPEISEIKGKRGHKAVKVTSLSSKVVVKSGTRISIGSVIKQNRERYVNIFGPDFFKRNEISEIMNMYLTATIMDPKKGYDRTSWIPRGR